LFVDLVVLRAVDLSIVRAAIGAGAVLVLVAGLIWDVD
jgi:hypothetical protein